MDANARRLNTTVELKLAPIGIPVGGIGTDKVEVSSMQRFSGSDLLSHRRALTGAYRLTTLTLLVLTVTPLTKLSVRVNDARWPAGSAR